MKSKKNIPLSRREFVKTSSAAVAGLTILPSVAAHIPAPGLMKRSFGRLNHEVTTFGLGGQASIQWTQEDVDPVAIILKAFSKGVNYYDTSNLYGPSQLNYGKAFRQLGLIPGISGYNENLRKSIFLTSKTHIRIAKGDLNAEGINNWTNGPEGSHTINDVKRTLSQIFGDGEGAYPEGAYLNMVLIHSLSSNADVNAVYEGLYNTDAGAAQIGALAALRDYRDGTNLTGLNPKEEKMIRHIGFSGHYDTGVMMDMIQRDKDNLLEGMLVAINANDKLNFNMQHNVIPVASAKNMGIIAMKVFADGAMYTKPATWSHQPSDVVRTIGSKELPFRPLIEYSLTTPGISTAIIGIGQISDNSSECQLTQNIMAAQIAPDGLDESERKAIEQMANKVKDGKTNYFQIAEGGLSAPRNVKAQKAGDGLVLVTWDTAFAGDSPIDHYELWKNESKAGEVSHVPQTTKKPFAYTDTTGTTDGKTAYKVVAVDKKGRKAGSQEIGIS